MIQPQVFNLIINALSLHACPCINYDDSAGLAVYIYMYIYIYKMVDVCFVGILKTRKNGLIKD